MSSKPINKFTLSLVPFVRCVALKVPQTFLKTNANKIGYIDLDAD